MRTRSARIGAALSVGVALAGVGMAPRAFAQKPPKGAATTTVGPAAVTVSTTPTPPPTPATPPPVTAADTGPATTLVATAPATAPPTTTSDEFDVTEKDGKRYVFIGLKYQGTIVPQAFMNLFVGGGETVWANAVTLQADLRKDGFSMIPGITYASLGTGNMLFLQHDQPANNEGNWSLVNSSLSILYLDVDLLWSVHIAKNFDFEYGAGFGVGFVFGTLEDNWVTTTTTTGATATANTPGALPGSIAVSGSKSYYVPCQTETQGMGCMVGNHSGGANQPPKVGGYNEPSWANGGSKPSLFPYISFPQIGLRIKPIKSFVARLGVGFALTGPWFGLSGYYGLEDALEKK